jgi:hypothetical protein
MLSPFEAAAYPQKPVPFYRTPRFLQATAASLLIAATMLFAPAPRVAAVLDGPDLTDSLGGWTIIEEEGSAGEWRLVEGGTMTAPLSNLPIPNDNPSGSFYLKDQTMPSSGVLYYEFTLPESGPIEIYFEYFTQSMPVFEDGTTMSLSEYPNQQFRVDIVTDITDPFGAPVVLANLLKTDVGDSNVTDWTVFSTDLASVAAVNAYRGEVGTQTAYLAFREVDNMGHFQVGIDDVRITAAASIATLCDAPGDEVEIFACAIATDPSTIEAAEVVVAPIGPSILKEVGTDSEIHNQAGTASDYGWKDYAPEEDARVGTEPVPAIPSGSSTYCLPPSGPPLEPPCESPAEEIVVDYVQFDKYALFESGEDGAAAGLYYVDFTVPDINSVLGFFYFLQSQADPAISQQSDFDIETSSNQQFIVELTEQTAFTDPNAWYTQDKSLLPKYQAMFWPENPTADDEWAYAEIDLSDLPPTFEVESGDQLRLIFGAVANAGPAQIGVGGLVLQAQTVDRSSDPDFATYATATRNLATFPREGTSYGVMSSGIADEFFTFSDTRSRRSTGMGGGAAAFSGDGTVSQGLDETIYDATILKIDLAAPLAATCLSLDVRFFSEEYPQFVGGTYNDAFLAELDPEVTLDPFVPEWFVGDNPDTEAVETTWITAPSNFAAAPVDAEDPTKTGVLSVNTTGTAWFRQSYASDTPMNGGSIPLRATTPIDPDDPNVLYLTLFDQSDQILDTVAIMDALQFWPNADCTGTFGEEPIVDEEPIVVGVDAAAPQAAWGSLDVTEVSESDLPLNLVVTFDQPVHGFTAGDLENVGDPDMGCEFSSPEPQDPSSGDALIPDGSAQEFEIVVTGCEPGELRPQLMEGSISGPSLNAGPSFNVTSFPVTITPAGGGGAGGGGGGDGGSSPSPSASPSLSPTPSASVSPSPSGIALTSPTPSASVVATSSPSETASPGSSPNPGASPGTSPEPPAPPSVAPTDSPIRDTDKAAVRVKDTAAGTRIYINERTSSSFIAASIPSIQQTISSPGIWFGGLLLSVLLALAAILLEAPLDWIKRRIKEIYERVVAYIEPKDRGARLRKIFGIRVDVFPFLIVGQLIAALNAPLDAIPPLQQLLLGCVYGAFAALIIHAVTKWPEVRLQRIEHNDGGEMRPQWLSIVLALGAVAIAQSFGFAPGLIVGIFAMRHFRKDLDERGLAQSSWHLSLMLIAASLISWVGLEWVALLITDPEAPLRVISDMVLGTLVVAGSQGLIWTLLNPAEAGSRALRHRSILRWVLALTAGTTMIIAILMGGGGAQGIFSPNATLEQLRGLIISGAVLFAVLLLLHRFTRFTAALLHRVNELESRLKTLETD